MSLGFNNSGDTVIATCVRTVTFFKINGSTFETKIGLGWGSSPADTIMCQALAGNTLFTGSFTGEIISWTENSIANRIKGHGKKINSIYASKDGTTLVTGSGDGTVKTWSV